MNGFDALKSPAFCIALSVLGLIGDKFYLRLRLGVTILSLSFVVV